MRKPWKKIVILSITTFFLLLGILVIHIVMVTKPSDEFHADLQLGRIDFPDNLDATQQEEALAAIRKIPTITHAKLNAPATSLVYSFPPGSANLHDIATHFQSNTSFESKPYIPQLMGSTKGCPIMDKYSLTYRFSTFITNVFY